MKDSPVQCHHKFLETEVFYVIGGFFSISFFWRGGQSSGAFFFLVAQHCESLLFLSSVIFSRFPISVWPLFPPSPSVPSLSSCSVSHIHYLSRVPPPPPPPPPPLLCGAGVGQRGWGLEVGKAAVWASSRGGRGCSSASEPLTRA